MFGGFNNVHVFVCVQKLLLRVGWREVDEGMGEMKGGGRRLDLGW